MSAAETPWIDHDHTKPRPVSKSTVVEVRFREPAFGEARCQARFVDWQETGDAEIVRYRRVAS